jgi:hypothetical protein
MLVGRVRVYWPSTPSLQEHNGMVEDCEGGGDGVDPYRERRIIEESKNKNDDAKED